MTQTLEEWDEDREELEAALDSVLETVELCELPRLEAELRDEAELLMELGRVELPEEGGGLPELFADERLDELEDRLEAPREELPAEERELG